MLNCWQSFHGEGSQSTIVSTVFLVQFSKVCQQNEGSKHRKSSNIWHKPSRRCLKGPLDIISSPGQTRLRTVRPQCVAGKPQMRRTQPKSGMESTRFVWTLSRGQAVPLSHMVCDRSVTSGWSDEKGTTDPATWCSEVPHLQWCSRRSCLHNYGSSNVKILF